MLQPFDYISLIILVLGLLIFFGYLVKKTSETDRYSIDQLTRDYEEDSHSYWETAEIRYPKELYLSIEEIAELRKIIEEHKANE